MSMASEGKTNGCKGSEATTDICDAKPELLENGEIRVLPSIFQFYGRRQAFSGPITTVKMFEDNQLVRPILETKGEGRVLVIDGGGSMRRAVMGGRLCQVAEEMGWAGVVAHGCIRDVDDINTLDIGVRALGTCPRRPTKLGGGEKHIPIHIAGTLIHDGEWLYADNDGIVISKTQLRSIPNLK